MEVFTKYFRTSHTSRHNLCKDKYIFVVTVFLLQAVLTVAVRVYR